MAKGNIGNLLQHFVVLRVAHRLVSYWNQSDTPIEYIDCYSMAPWEPITGGQPQGFVALVEAFRGKRDEGDFVASAFLQAWQHRYGPEAVPKRPRRRDYPNTAVLLRTAFPNQAWRMRLHEDDSTEPGKKTALTEWASQQSNGDCEVAGDWTKSKLVCNRPAAVDRPVLIMLDPFQIVGDDNASADRGGYLPARLLRFLVGKHALRIIPRPVDGKVMPVVVVLFSYSDANPDIADKIVREQFADEQWGVERVRSGPWQGRNGRNWHIGWIASAGLGQSFLGSAIQDEWNCWANVEEN